MQMRLALFGILALLGPSSHHRPAIVSAEEEGSGSSGQSLDVDFFGTSSALSLVDLVETGGLGTGYGSLSVSPDDSTSITLGGRTAAAFRLPGEAFPIGLLTTLEVDVDSAPSDGYLAACVPPEVGPAYDAADLLQLGYLPPASASQSTTCWGAPASRAVDGNTNGVHGHGSVTHTCGENDQWFLLDLGDEVATGGGYVIGRVTLYNRRDSCCQNTNSGAILELLDESMEVVPTSNGEMIVPGDSAPLWYWDFPSAPGARYVRVRREGGGTIQLAEIRVKGWNVLPRRNLARNDNGAAAVVVATQSSTCWGAPASRAVDGNTNGVHNHGSVTHTCGPGEGDALPWWMVDLGSSATIYDLELYNRSDSCCRNVNGDSTVEVLDANDIVVASRQIAPGATDAVFRFDFPGGVEGRKVRVRKNSGGTVQLAEVKVLGRGLTSDFDARTCVALAGGGAPAVDDGSGSSRATLPLGQMFLGSRAAAADARGAELARGRPTSQSSTAHGGMSSRAVDGDANGYYHSGRSISHTALEASPWWRVELDVPTDVNSVYVWNRQDACPGCSERQEGTMVQLLDGSGTMLAERMVQSNERLNVVEFRDAAYVAKAVRIQKPPHPSGSQQVIQLAEVQVYGGDVGLDAGYLTLVQDGGDAETSGTLSNVKIYDDEGRNDLAVTVFGDAVGVPNLQMAMSENENGNDDARHRTLSVSPDGAEINASGNNWKRFDLPGDSSFEVDPSTVLKFDFQLLEEGRMHAICLTLTASMRNGRRDCFVTSGTIAPDDARAITVEQTSVGETKSYEIYVGKYFTGRVTAIGIVLDSDGVEGQSTWKNIEIYRLPSLNVGLDSEVLALPNSQASYEVNNVQASLDGIGTVSEDGNSISLRAGQQVALELPSPIWSWGLGDFVVSFDFTLDAASGLNAICFEENLELGDADNQGVNKVDPRRCVVLQYDKNLGKVPNYHIAKSQTWGGQTHHYALKLSSILQHPGHYYPIKYVAFINQDDGTGAGSSTFSNIKIDTSLTSCLSEMTFDLDDCTTEKFLDAVKIDLEANAECANKDPMLEVMAIIDGAEDYHVARHVEYTCAAAYARHAYDFADTLATEVDTKRQLVMEHIDGGAMWNYEVDGEGTSDILRDAKMIGRVKEDLGSEALFSWPDHHALDDCSIGMAMCCFTASRKATVAAANSDVCYVNMQSSRYTAHVRDGYSIYPDQEDVYCEGFAWGEDGASSSAALRGNLLFEVGFVKGLYLDGRVEQIAGAPLCGCIDRMPTVTEAACTDATLTSNSISVTYDGDMFYAKQTFAGIKYGDCGGMSLPEFYKTLGRSEAEERAVETKVVGAGECPGAINRFLAGKGLELQ